MAHGDYTGQQKAVLAQQYADQQQLAASSMSMVSQVVTEGRNNVIDLRTPEDIWREQHGLEEDPSSEDGVIQVDKKDPQYQPVQFRCRETLEQVTVGKDREFSLEEGRIYKAPQWLASHLDDKGLVYH